MTTKSERNLIAKYAPKAADVADNHPLAAMVNRAIWDLDATERQMTEAARKVREAAERVEAWVAWQPGDAPVYGLNPTGTLGQAGGDLERLVAVHATQVTHLQALVFTASIDAA